MCQYLERNHLLPQVRSAMSALRSWSRRLARMAFFSATCILVLSSAHATAQQKLLDRYIKVKVPADWQERRSWELGDDRSLPLFQPASQAVAFVWGFDRPLYRQGYIQSLASGNRLSHRLEMDLSQWPAEASRYYAMVSGGFGMRSSAHTVTVGPSLNPGQVRYLGKFKVRMATLEVVEYVSDTTVDQPFATKYKLSSDLVGTRAQILLGQAMFAKQSGGYTLAACRFTTKPEVDWIKPLLEGVEALPKAERARGLAVEQLRDPLSHAAAIIQDHRYA